MASIIHLSPASYSAHSLHAGDRVWSETNCYVDVLIELIHSLGFEPIAGLAFTLAIDFEEDQWTFFKYPLNDLLQLYGMDVQELNPWNDLARHIETQVSAGRSVLVELDSYFLPDTVGTAYSEEHVKSTVAVNAMDTSAKFMGYFHGQGYYEIIGNDFEQVFQLNGLVHERMLPPYIELIKVRKNLQAKSENELVERSIMSLRQQFLLMPEDGPLERFKLKFEKDLPWLISDSIEQFHQYSFATLRQFGACYELAATYLNWLDSKTDLELDIAGQHYLAISNDVKAFQFKLARTIARKKPIDLAPLDKMAEHWWQAKQLLKIALSL
ncbi:DUF1839 family protein [Teredinibacter haidensis]|uniref:DUF1839 family protein n=1 Tax=Teredinibacter haidensis TaxID=2731755 RepID=UPI000948D2FC|nr:DUF1839 family protein [Teredinibacter haidensis]